MRLKDNFPNTKEEAIKFGVIIRDAKGVFKIFEHNKNIERTINSVNLFLLKNGYNQISVDAFVKNDYSFESNDKIITLSLHGYQEALVLFLERE